MSKKVTQIEVCLSTFSEETEHLGTGLAWINSDVSLKKFKEEFKDFELISDVLDMGKDYADDENGGIDFKFPEDREAFKAWLERGGEYLTSKSGE